MFFVLMSLACMAMAQTQDSIFQIVYNADLIYAEDQTWLTNIANDWCATAINLRIKWSDVLRSAPTDTMTDENCNWTRVDRCIKIIVNTNCGIPGNLKLYLRINMCEVDTSWSIPSNEYYGAIDGTPYFNSNWSNTYKFRKMYSIFSNTAVNKMKRFIHLLLNHISTLQIADGFKNFNVGCLQVVINPTDESELPFQRMLTENTTRSESAGFSLHERQAFIDYLKSPQKYDNGITALDSKLGVSDSSFEQIRDSMLDSTWYWHNNLDNPYKEVIHPKLKKEWIDFKTKTLRDFYQEMFHECDSVYNGKSYGAVYGIQPGPIYDNSQEYKGIYDPTPIFENACYITTGDIVDYEKEFYFSADMLRSIARFWMSVKGDGRNVKFATESNWMYYNCYSGISPDRETWAHTLCELWGQQLRTYYARGASAIFISNWGNDPGDPYTPVSVIDRRDTTRYRNWKTTLLQYRQAALVSYNTLKHLNVYHVGWEMLLYRGHLHANNNPDFYWHYYNIGGPYLPNNTDLKKDIHPIYNFVTKPTTFNAFSYSYNDSCGAYDGNSDFITNFMIENMPTGWLTIKGYKKLVFTGTSEYISDEAYNKLLKIKNDSSIIMINSTYAKDGTYYFIPGIRNEYNDERKIPLLLN